MNDHDRKFAPIALLGERAISFGPFRLFPTQRLLLEGDKPLRVGSRALDILIALVETPGELISKENLMARVWPSTFVEPANLTVHVAALRRALGDGQGDRRYLVNITGRGYRFVAPVTVLYEPESPTARRTGVERKNNLPATLVRLIGRSEIVGALAAQLSRDRFLTIAGPGGIGKTSVALAVAEELVASFQDGVWLIDLAAFNDQTHVPNAVASVLGLEIRCEDPLPGLIAALKDKQMLLVLDSCEHVIDTSAVLVTGILRGAPRVRILATSREPLRAEGERVYRLPSLATPSERARLTAPDALCFPAVQLFVERAAASLGEFALSDADAPIVGEICAKLDGIPLAIELAAARINVFGVRALAARLENRMRLLTNGHRAALPRHQTMSATLDWSFGLLTEAEQLVLRRIAVFAAGFILQAAGVVAADARNPESSIVDRLTELVSKSLVAADVGDAEPRLRLLETTRAYALTRLAESGESDMVGRRHAEFFRDQLESGARDRVGADGCLAENASELDNIRSALAWAFGTSGDVTIGVALAVASAPLWLDRSLFTECAGWMRMALKGLDAATQGSRKEMLLQAALGMSLMFTRGICGEAYAALARAAGLAGSFDDPEYQLQILHALWLYHIRLAEFPRALALARQSEAVAERMPDPVAAVTADRMLGISLHFLGDQANARAHLERALARPSPTSRRAYIVRFGVDHRTFALSILANVLWLQGFPDQALRAGETSIEEAQTLGHPVSLCMALRWGGGAISLWLGDLAAAERYTAILIDLAEKHALDSDYAGGLGLQGQLSVRRGDAVTGARLLRSVLDRLDDSRHQMLCSEFLSDLGRAIAALGNVDTGLAVIDEALERLERNDDRWYMPELLRIKGELLLMLNERKVSLAEGAFRQSLDSARKQGALSWELRAAISLATLRREQGRKREARNLLSPVHGRFTEGFETADLQTAKQLIDELT